MRVKENKGITMVSLVAMIVVVFILAGISITEGTTLLRKTKVENIMTNMITIRAKAKVYAEEVNSQIWDASDKVAERKSLYSSKYNMREITNNDEIISKVSSSIKGENGCEFYEITEETLRWMGLEKLIKDSNEGDYIVVYNLDDYSNLDVIYRPGMKYEKDMYYTLSSIQERIGE